MQPEYAHSRRDFRPFGFLSRLNACRLLLILSAISLFLSGIACRQPPNLVDPVPVKPFEGVRLKVGIGSGVSQPHLVRQSAKEWSVRTGAEVEFVPGGWNGEEKADLAIVAAADLPRYATSGRVVPIPDSLRSSRHAYKWNDLVASMTDRLATWDTRPYGLPLFNAGRLLVYRTDRWAEFAAARKLDSTQPETWEELCDFAEFYNKPGKPSLPPRSKRNDLTNEFHRIASCYDRVAVTDSNLGPGPKTPEERDAFFSFDFSVQTGTPRINQPAFLRAATLLKRMQACRPAEPSDDPTGAFRDGNAVACLAPLELLVDLTRSGSAVAGKFGIAPPPASRVAYVNGVETKLEAVNRVPYLGEGVWLGVVTTECKNVEAAWDFLAEFAHPGTSSLDFISSGKWGASGFRGSHFDGGNRNHWFGYGLDGPHTERLIDLERQNEAIGIANPTLVLRLPDRDSYLAILSAELDRILKGQVEPKVGLDEAARKWAEKKIDPVRYRISLGL